MRPIGIDKMLSEETKRPGFREEFVSSPRCINEETLNATTHP